MLQQEQMQVRQPAMLKLSQEQLRKHLSLVAITAMTEPSGKWSSRHILCLDPNFETRLPNNESGPFELTVEDKMNQKEAVDMNKKVMCQFIQAFGTMKHG